MNSTKILASALLASLAAAGCSTTTPGLDARFGESSLALRAQQVRDPAASLRNENRPVDGIEGQAASNAVDQYYKSFTKPAPPMTVINLAAPIGGQ